MKAVPRILVCDDDSLVQMALKEVLKGKYQVQTAFHTDEALGILKREPVDLVLLDIQMRTDDEGLRAIPVFRECDPNLGIILISGITDFLTVREALRLGATDYIPKDFDPNDVLHTVDQAIQKRRLLHRQEQQNFEALSQQQRHIMVGSSPKMQQLRKLIEKLRRSSENVIITGETGTGKELIARQLRGVFPDGTLRPFISIDSSTIQSSMAESLLFGHEKGAFTGADRTAKGLFEEADGGIIYFDEIANMPLEIQVKLLRVLQEKEVMRLGSSKVIPLEFRVVCATNKNLEVLSKSGKFQADLYQRLNVIPLEVPPFRDRIEDLPELVAHFLKLRAPVPTWTFTEAALSALKNYAWPGNIRELYNVVAYVVTMAEGPEIDLADLPPQFRDLKPGNTPSQSTAGFYQAVQDFERSYLEREYAASHGNMSKLALKIGMDRSHLYSKLKQYGIHTTKSGKDSATSQPEAFGT